MFYKSVTVLKSVLMINVLYLSTFAHGQNGLSKTAILDIGKVGNLRFSLVKSDTANDVAVTQSAYGIQMVNIPQNELTEVVRALNSFAAEIEKKVADKTTFTYKTKNLLLSCGYFKSIGWFITIQNTDPAIEQNSEVMERKTGIQVNNFVEIKPKQLQEVIKIISKAI